MGNCNGSHKTHGYVCRRYEEFSKATATPWGPNLGSKLEGHQSPTFDWHWEVQNRITSILRKNGITYKQLSNTSAGNFIIHEIYRIEEGLINLDSAEFLE